MLALPANRLPSGDAWQYELKFDGYSALAVRHEGRVTLFSRNRKNSIGVFLPLLALWAVSRMKR